MPLLESDSQVNVNWVFAGEGFLAEDRSRRLMFSCPFGKLDGEAAASAIAAEMIPWSDGKSRAANKRCQF